MSTCYKTSDNKYKECAPRMSDGRHFTDYRPNCDVDILVQRDNDITNSFSYRKFLQSKANTLMDLNRDHACKKNCCGPCEDDKPVKEGFINYGTMLPEKDMQICNSNNCVVVPNDPNGLGLGRQYHSVPTNPKIKNPKPSENKCTSLEDDFKLYGDFNLSNLARNSMPFGGRLNDEPNNYVEQEEN